MEEAEKPESKSEQACLDSNQKWFVYLLRCADDSLYCGVTTNLTKRLRQHNGELVGGAKYTKVRQPCELVYSEPSENRRSATQREYAIKQLSRAQKLQLIR
ncbi:MAG: GIY-YIG nuclease family protein [Thiotrichales bacterium]|nr:GIY-YIG nuclease family protein [Thiotrichales bacterium]